MRNLFKDRTLPSKFLIFFGSLSGMLTSGSAIKHLAWNPPALYHVGTIFGTAFAIIGMFVTIPMLFARRQNGSFLTLAACLIAIGMTCDLFIPAVLTAFNSQFDLGSLGKLGILAYAGGVMLCLVAKEIPLLGRILFILISLGGCMFLSDFLGISNLLPAVLHQSIKDAGIFAISFGLGIFWWSILDIK